jgi:hypothetical protein
MPNPAKVIPPYVTALLAVVGLALVVVAIVYFA